MEVFQVTATEWLGEWLKKFPEDNFLVDEMREDGKTDEQIKSFLEGV